MRLSHYLEVLDGLRNKNVWQACSIHNQHRVIITVSRLSLGKDMCYLLYLFNLVAESPNNRGLNHPPQAEKVKPLRSSQERGL